MYNSPKDLRKEILGRNAEADVRKYLKKKGYKILDYNYVTPFGEADIVALSRDGYTCFVEVKARTDDGWGLPAEAVNEEKRNRYRRMAEYYCMTKKREIPIRFDVASVLGGEIEYFENAYF